jgi:hypothetical protein
MCSLGKTQLESLDVQGATIAVDGLIADFYEQRAYTSAFDDKKIRDLIVAIEEMLAHDLNPDDYHRRTLQELLDRQESLAPQARADCELLLMDAFLRMSCARSRALITPWDG